MPRLVPGLSSTALMPPRSPARRSLPSLRTYLQAQKAYAVAYQQYMLESQGANAKWTSYVNELFGEADVELFGLYA